MPADDQPAASTLTLAEHMAKARAARTEAGFRRTKAVCRKAAKARWAKYYAAQAEKQKTA